MTVLSQTALLHELEPVVEKNLDRHLSLAKEWFPHEYVPWSEGRTFDGPLGGEPWAEKDSTLPEVARTALIVNLLTEDNLPSYHHEIASLFGRDGAWGTWVHRWTAEEGRHGTAIRDYLTVTRAVDPVALERARMVHMSAGYHNTHDDEVLHSLAYVSFQELATRISHRNTGRATADPICEALLARVAADENLHMVFYRNLLAAAFELAPSQAMRAVADVLADFQMPGVGIEGFARKSVAIALAGIYDLRQHRDEVVVPVLRQWNLFEATGLDADGEVARDQIAAHLDTLELQASRFEEKRAARAARRPTTPAPSVRADHGVLADNQPG
ncbi:acyl-ACP desaturase [Micromonospora sp. NPDC007271]|uniref:acyl-ACP desaturase n=1 Tax=Micromonospora sp. NPDC007271 TaxID=3154587 RepID=UPI0033E96401